MTGAATDNSPNRLLNPPHPPHPTPTDNPRPAHPLCLCLDAAHLGDVAGHPGVGCGPALCGRRRGSWRGRLRCLWRRRSHLGRRRRQRPGHRRRPRRWRLWRCCRCSWRLRGWCCRRCCSWWWSCRSSGGGDGGRAAANQAAQEAALGLLIVLGLDQAHIQRRLDLLGAQEGVLHGVKVCLRHEAQIQRRLGAQQALEAGIGHGAGPVGSSCAWVASGLLLDSNGRESVRTGDGQIHNLGGARCWDAAAFHFSQLPPARTAELSEQAGCLRPVSPFWHCRATHREAVDASRRSHRLAQKPCAVRRARQHLPSDPGPLHTCSKWI